jgi:hypothetical protein
MNDCTFLNPAGAVVSNQRANGFIRLIDMLRSIFGDGFGQFGNAGSQREADLPLCHFNG